MPLSRAFSKYPSGSQAREPFPQVPFRELPQRETLLLQSPFQPYLKVPVDEPIPSCPTKPP